MSKKPTYEELIQRVKELEKESINRKLEEKALINFAMRRKLGKNG